MLNALAPLAGLLRAEQHEAGLHLIGWLPNKVDERALSQALSQAGVDAPALPSFALKPIRKGLLLGYTAPAAEMVAAAQVGYSVLPKFVGSAYPTTRI